MQGLPFLKMHGCGNDFVVLDARDRPWRPSAGAARRIADRHTGVGCDLIVLLAPADPDEADARLVFLNADGSESGACGNGARCAARLVGEGTGRADLRLATSAGVLPARREGDRWTVVMPEPRLGWREIPLAEAHDTLALPLDVEGLGRPTAVSMGNPHVTFFVTGLDAVDVPRIGAALTSHPLFPERANIGFAEPRGRRAMRLRVYERGVGLTLACGSGACAAVVAGVRRGVLDHEVTVRVDGGELAIAWPGEGRVAMTGPATRVYAGVLEAGLLDG